MGSPGRPSRAALKKWIEDKGVSQTAFGEAIGCGQQHVSRILDDGKVSVELAKRIEIAAGGAAARDRKEAPPVPWEGWFTAREVREWAELEERARSFGLAATG